MRVSLVFRWWGKPVDTKPTERLFMHVEGLELLVYNAEEVPVCSCVSQCVQVYQQVEELTRKNTFEDKELHVKQPLVQQQELQEEYELGLFNHLFPVIGFSVQLARVFVGNQSLEKVLLIRTEQLVGFRAIAATPGEMGEHQQTVDTRCERLEVMLITNLEFAETQARRQSGDVG